MDEGESSATKGCPQQFFDRDWKHSHELQGQICHTECNRCVPQTTSKDKQLCPSCRHMQLRHLLLCVPSDSWEYLVLGQLGELKQRPECPLCQVVVQLVARNKDNEETTLKSVVDDNSLCVLSSPRQQFASHLKDALLLRVSFSNRAVWLPPDYHLHIRFQDIDISESRVSSAQYEENDLPAIRPYSPGALIRLNRQRMRWSSVQTKVDWAILCEWLQTCEYQHSTCCRAMNPVGRVGPTRVIDVERLCVVEVRYACRYATLSYVWGECKAALRLTSANFRQLEEPGALTDHWDEIPLTIADAIKACSELGERYLWVDSLCILQDSAESTQREIKAMGSIYTRSAFTIVAASGEHASSGLPGVSTALRSPTQSVQTFDNLEVMEVLPSILQDLETSTWNTRGWTYQEATLSSRTLIFTSTQVYFQCHARLCNEDPCIGYAGLSMWGVRENHRRLIKGRSLRFDRFTEYSNRLGEYTHRRLSFQQDVFNAFMGITLTIYDQPTDYLIYGLPVSDFDEALLWKPIKRQANRRDTTEVVVPSWSWGACDGPVTILTNNNEYIGSFLQYFVCVGADRGLEPVIPARDWKEWPKRPESIFAGGYSLPDLPREVYREIALKEGCDPREGDIKESRDTVSGPSIDEYPVAIQKLATQPGRLLFRTQAALFKIVDHSDVNDEDQVFFPSASSLSTEPAVLNIFNKHNRLAGFLSLDRENSLTLNSKDGRDEPTHELIALSIARSQEVDGYEEYVEYQVAHSIASNRELPSIPEMGKWQGAPVTKLGNELYAGDRTLDVRYYHGERRPIRTPLVNVMLISWAGGVAQREGLGQVYLARWKDSEPQVKTIILE